MDNPSSPKCNRQPVLHVAANAEARSLVAKHDGQAGRVVDTKLELTLSAGDIDAALYLDQVRREIERIEREKGPDKPLSV